MFAAKYQGYTVHLLIVRYLFITTVLLLFSNLSQAVTSSCIATPNQASKTLQQLMQGVIKKDINLVLKQLDSAWPGSLDENFSKKLALLDLGLLITRSPQHQLEKICTEGQAIAVGYYHNQLTDAIDSVSLEMSQPALDSVAKIRVRFAIHSAVKPTEFSDDAQRATELKRYLQRLADYGAFSGSVLVARKGKPIVEESYGLANKEIELQAAPSTAFNLASLNKLFTSVAVMQLVEADRLNLDASLANLLLEFSDSQTARQIQLKHLLSHTSGIIDEVEKPAFLPGTDFAYSNYGYGILGDVIEATTGMRYEDYLQLYLFAPAGMASTARFELKQPVDALAIGYEPKFTNNQFVSMANPFLHTISGGSVGGLYSTVQDLQQFINALKSGQLLKPDTVRLLSTPKPELGAVDYGFGTLLWRGPGIWGHAGDLPGADADLEIYSGTDYSAVVLANQSSVNEPVMLKIRQLFYPQGVVDSFCFIQQLDGCWGY